MTRVRVERVVIALDGCGAGPKQDIDNLRGVSGTELHQRAIPTHTFPCIRFGADDGTTGIDDAFAARGFNNVGARILRRNMFGPLCGLRPDMNWRGWWGDSPPDYVPVFVLTHHARPTIEMAGDTTFHFTIEGIHEALDRARAAAAGKDVRRGGGPSTVRQYLSVGLIDDLHIAIAPVLIGDRERLFEGADLRATSVLNMWRRRRPRLSYHAAEGAWAPDLRLDCAQNRRVRNVHAAFAYRACPASNGTIHL